MADVDIKKNTPQSGLEQNQQRLEQQQGSSRGVSRRSGYDPFSLSLIPSELFSNPFSMSPFSLMRRMTEEMDRVFGSGRGASSGATSWMPAIEVKQREGNLEVCADLPGMNKDDVKVEITGDEIIMQGEHKFEHEEGKREAYRSERRYGQFYRAIPLPEGANGDQAKAQFKDGVLQITVPVSEPKSNRRQIPVEATSSTENK